MPCSDGNCGQYEREINELKDRLYREEVAKNGLPYANEPEFVSKEGAQEKTIQALEKRLDAHTRAACEAIHLLKATGIFGLLSDEAKEWFKHHQEHDKNNGAESPIKHSEEKINWTLIVAANRKIFNGALKEDENDN